MRDMKEFLLGCWFSLFLCSTFFGIGTAETVFKEPSIVTLVDVIECYENIDALLKDTDWKSLEKKCANFSEKLHLEEKERLLNSMQIFRSVKGSGKKILSAYYNVIVEYAYTQEYSSFYKKVWEIWEDFCAKKVSDYYNTDLKDRSGMTLLQLLWSKTGEGSDLYSDNEVEKLGETFKISASDSSVGTDSSVSDSDSRSEGELTPPKRISRVDSDSAPLTSSSEDSSSDSMADSSDSSQGMPDLQITTSS